MTMNILLVRPPGPLGQLKKISSNEPPFGLLYLAGALREHGGLRISLLDLESGRFSREDLVKNIRKHDPHVVGIGCMTPSVVSGHRVAEIVKRTLPRAATVSGGPHVTPHPGAVLEEFPFFDIAVHGEGETTLPALCTRLGSGEPLAGLPGIAHRANGEVRTEPAGPLIRDIDDIPFPARDMIDPGSFEHTSRIGCPSGGRRVTELFTSRGCPYPCTFCASALTHGKKVRFRSSENVRQEVRLCREELGVGHLTIHDDTFNVDPRRLEKLCSVFSEFGVTWDCDARADRLTPDRLKTMARSGCTQIALGVESGSPQILRALRKEITVDQVISAFQWAREAGIRRYAYFMVGSHPSESEEDIALTRDLIFRIDPDFMAVAVMMPYPGTEIYRTLKKRGHLLDRSWDRYSPYTGRPPYRTDLFTPADLVRKQKEMIRAFYFRPRYAFRTLRTISSVREAAYFLRASIVSLGYLLFRR